MKNFRIVVVVMLVVVLICMLFSLTAPMSKTKAIKFAQKQQTLGNYCSGYHIEKGDGTAYVIFRNKNTENIAVSINTQIDTAIFLFNNYKKEEEK